MDCSRGTEQHKQVERLLKEALEAPTPQQLFEFVDYSTRFRRLAIWNARMAYIQRPGAQAIASEYEWKMVGRYVLPDAVPIIILWPFTPIRFVYELEDTGPPIDRTKINDSFAVRGEFKAQTLSKLITELGQQKKFSVEVVKRAKGFNYAGSVIPYESLLADNPDGQVLGEGLNIGAFAKEHVEPIKELSNDDKPSYRVVLNDQMNPSEQFVTLAHELGHIFCGHLGASKFHSFQNDESGWPDRHSLDNNHKEIEAEAVAAIVASRAGLLTRSAQYLTDYAKEMGIKKVEIDRIVRAAARIERLAGIHHGMMEFN